MQICGIWFNHPSNMKIYQKNNKKDVEVVMKKTAGILANAGRQVFLAANSAKNYLFTVVYMKYL